MTHHDDHAEDGGFAQDIQHLMRRRAVVAGLGLVGASGLIWAATGNSQAIVTGQVSDGICI
jgi:hypothetical protein